MQQLKLLGLSGTKITDAGLKEVAKMRRLEELYLITNQITKAGVAKLKKALPNCAIIGP